MVRWVRPSLHTGSHSLNKYCFERSDLTLGFPARVEPVFDSSDVSGSAKVWHLSEQPSGQNIGAPPSVQFEML